MGTRFGDLPGFDTAIKDPLITIGHGPGAATGTTAIGAIAVRVQFAKIIATGPSNGPAFFKIGLAEGFQRFAAIITGIVIGNGHLMHRLIQLDFALFNIFKQQIKDGDDFEFLECFGVPSVQPGPGCKVGVTSLGQEQHLAVQPAHVVNDTTDHRFHRLIVAGKKSPVHTFPVL